MFIGVERENDFAFVCAALFFFSFLISLVFGSK